MWKSSKNRIKKKSTYFYTESTLPDVVTENSLNRSIDPPLHSTRLPQTCLVHSPERVRYAPIISNTNTGNLLSKYDSEKILYDCLGNEFDEIIHDDGDKEFYPQFLEPVIMRNIPNGKQGIDTQPFLNQVEYKENVTSCRNFRSPQRNRDIISSKKLKTRSASIAPKTMFSPNESRKIRNSSSTRNPNISQTSQSFSDHQRKERPSLEAMISDFANASLTPSSSDNSSSNVNDMNIPRKRKQKSNRMTADTFNARENAQLGNEYGYKVSDLESLLTRASPKKPANLPMVLKSSSRLYNMRNTDETRNLSPIRPMLPAGVIVNVIYKTREWLYVRSPHGVEGYIPFGICSPLGILPQQNQINLDIPENNHLSQHHFDNHQNNLHLRNIHNNEQLDSEQILQSPVTRRNARDHVLFPSPNRRSNVYSNSHSHLSTSRTGYPVDTYPRSPTDCTSYPSNAYSRLSTNRFATDTTGVFPNYPRAYVNTTFSPTAHDINFTENGNTQYISPTATAQFYPNFSCQEPPQRESRRRTRIKSNNLKISNQTDFQKLGPTSPNRFQSINRLRNPRETLEKAFSKRLG